MSGHDDGADPIPDRDHRRQVVIEPRRASGPSAPRRGERAGRGTAARPPATASLVLPSAPGARAPRSSAVPRRAGGIQRAAKWWLSTPDPADGADRADGPSVVRREALDPAPAESHALGRLVALHLHLGRGGVAESRPPEHLDRQGPAAALDLRRHLDEIAPAPRTRRAFSASRSPSAHRKRSSPSPRCANVTCSADGQEEGVAQPRVHIRVARLDVERARSARDRVAPSPPGGPWRPGSASAARRRGGRPGW